MWRRVLGRLLGITAEDGTAGGPLDRPARLASLLKGDQHAALGLGYGRGGVSDRDFSDLRASVWAKAQRFTFSLPCALREAFAQHTAHGPQGPLSSGWACMRLG